MREFLAVLTVLLLITACRGVDRSAAIATCGAFASMNDSVPNPSAGQSYYSMVLKRTIAEPDFIRPSEAELRTRITSARRFAADSQDNDLQRLSDALRISSDGNGRPIVVVPTLFLDYCRQENY